MYRKRKYRRLSRNRARPRSRVYMRRRMRRMRYKTRPEMKITAFSAGCQSNKLAMVDTAAATLYSHQNFGANWLNYISQGTNYSDRIGNTIFVKGIRLRMLTFACSESEQISISNFLLRIIVWSGANTAASVITNFFNSSNKINFLAPINRKKVHNVFYDKVHYFNSGGYINDSSSRNATSGAVKMMNIWLPMNRRVTYTQGGGPKDEKDQINLAVLVASPGMCNTTYDLRQIACSNYTGQIFFTDN